jgi:hypothetical protein
LRLDRRKAAPLYDDMVERAIETKVALAKTKWHLEKTKVAPIVLDLATELSLHVCCQTYGKTGS